jgi:hypothetical protein
MKTSKFAPWLMLFSRILLFFCVQAVFAFGFFLSGSAQAWEKSANWWPITVAIADLVGIFLLIKFFKDEDKRYWDLFHFERAHIKGDLLALLGVTLLVAPISYFPNVWLGQALFGNSAATLDLIVRPLPFWAVYAAIFLFPIMQGLTEIATYFGFVMPRLEARGMHRWLAISLPALILGLQHIAVPLLFDARFILWRGLMFLPFAFMTGIVFHWRPRLLPYFIVIHILMNMSFVTMFLNTAY